MSASDDGEKCDNERGGDVVCETGVVDRIGNIVCGRRRKSEEEGKVVTGVATSVEASSSFAVSAMSLGGMSVSSQRPCTMVWSTPLLTDIGGRGGPGRGMRGG